MTSPTAESLHQADVAGGSLTWPRRLRLAAEILASYLWVRRALRAGPVASVAERIALADEGSAVAAPSHGPGRIEEAARLGRAVGRTLALAPGDTRCLIRSLVLVRLLSRRLIVGTLVIGVRTTPEFLGHAWVEVAGCPVLPPGDESFGRLVEL